MNKTMPMPLTPPRQLRAAVAHLLPRRLLNKAQEERQTLILNTTPILFVEFGRLAMTVATVAAALGISPRAFRFLFLDLDALLGDILRRHCQTILDDLKTVPRDAPGRVAELCVAYHAATRLPVGHGHTDAHLLLVRDLPLLPDDERKPTEAYRKIIGQIIAGPHAESALRILDDANLTLPEIQSLIAKLLEPTEVEAAAAKHPKPAAKHAVVLQPSPTLPKPYTQGPSWNRHERRALKARAGPP